MLSSVMTRGMYFPCSSKVPMGWGERRLVPSDMRYYLGDRTGVR